MGRDVPDLPILGGVFRVSPPRSAGGWSGTLHETGWIGGGWRSAAISGKTIFATDPAGVPGPVYVFSEPAGGWSGTVNSSAQLTASDGTGFAAVAASDQTVVASSGRAAYVFTEPAGGWASENQSAKLTNPSDESYPVGISGPTLVANTNDRRTYSRSHPAAGPTRTQQQRSRQPAAA